MKVEEILQHKGDQVHRLARGSGLKDAISLLKQHNIGAILVVDKDDQIAGILSERDIVRDLASHGISVMNRKVDDCMTPNPYTCHKQEAVNDILERMTHKRVRHMPVVEESKIIGLVSIGDVVKCKIAETEQEAAALRDYIGG